MNNPLFILQTLDHHLDHPVELTLYGRAALALEHSRLLVLWMSANGFARTGRSWR